MKRKLGLIPKRTETLNLNTFGNEKFSKRDCDLFKLRLQGKHGEDVNISALRFEAICSSVPSKVSLHEHPHLLDLDLAGWISGNIESQDYIDVLIGSDYYMNMLDIAPRNASIVMGIANATANTAGFLSPMLVGFITHNKTAEEWRTVFWITFLIYVMGTLVFNTLMSGDRQEWDKIEGVSSESSSDNMAVTSR